MKFDFDDINLVPKKCIVNSRSECDTSVTLGNFTFKLPIVPANMECVLDTKLAESLSSNGYFYILHRFLTDEQILNFIEIAAIRDKKMPTECLVLLQFSYPDYEVEQLKIWIKKFFRLWCRNQWKRERYAPSFHFDDHNLDPRSWCRFPILSGGFEKELSAL
jgi:hypothetical protein